jgi:hypothetical protein
MENYELLLKKILYKYGLDIYTKCFNIIYKDNTVTIIFNKNKLENIIHNIIDNIAVEVIKSLPININNIDLLKIILKEHFNIKLVNNINNISGKYKVKTKNTDIIRKNIILKIFKSFNINQLYIKIMYISDTNSFTYFLNYYRESIISTYGVLIIFIFLSYYSYTMNE